MALLRPQTTVVLEDQELEDLVVVVQAVQAYQDKATMAAMVGAALTTLQGVVVVVAQVLAAAMLLQIICLAAPEEQVWYQVSQDLLYTTPEVEVEVPKNKVQATAGQAAPVVVVQADLILLGLQELLTPAVAEEAVATTMPAPRPEVQVDRVLPWYPMIMLSNSSQAAQLPATRAALQEPFGYTLLPAAEFYNQLRLIAKSLWVHPT